MNVRLLFQKTSATLTILNFLFFLEFGTRKTPVHRLWHLLCFIFLIIMNIVVQFWCKIFLFLGFYLPNDSFIGQILSLFILPLFTHHILFQPKRTQTFFLTIPIPYTVELSRNTPRFIRQSPHQIMIGSILLTLGFSLFKFFRFLTLQVV